MVSELATEELAARLDEPEHALVDVRPIDAYNGWRLDDEPRGGHVPDARSLPLSWLERAELPALLSEKGIEPDRPVSVYGYAEADARRLADRLSGLGYSDVSVYPGFRNEWVVDPDRPLDRLDRHRKLVPPAWLSRVVDGEDPTGTAADGSECVVCHVHYDAEADYAMGHVPGAIPLETTALEDPEDWNRRPPEELRTALVDHGISSETTVVLYGRDPSDGGSCAAESGDESTTHAGHLAAMRCAALMLYAGVEDVRVLNGGITAWKRDGLPLSTRAVRPRPVDAFGADVPGRPDCVVDTPGAKALLDADGAELVSVRSRSEYIGSESGYDYLSEAGRIPGAVLAAGGRDPYHMGRYRNVDQTMREYHEIAAMWAERGIVPEKRVAFYCGTGWRGSEAFMAAYLMGWPDVAVYDGGWYEWSADPDTPIERGAPDRLADG